MIEKSIVKGLVEEWLEGRDYFLVDVSVSADDRIVVEIDHAEGVWIEDCVELSRFIESRLSREEEDYELEVGSAGIGQPFKVLQQYVNHVGERGGRAHGRRAQAPRGADGCRPGEFRSDDEGKEEAGGGEASPPGGRSGYTAVYGSKVHEVFNKF